jgi:hypothetical protein
VGWGGGEGGEEADFLAFDCTSQDTVAHGHVVDGVQEASKTASKGAKNGAFCPGKERCGVEPLLHRIVFTPSITISQQRSTVGIVLAY